MTTYKLNPAQVARQMASNAKIVQAFTSEQEGFAQGIREFWSANAETVNARVAEMKGLKSFFGGDIFPSYQRNIATSVGLYVDTVVLPDPLLKLGDFIGHVEPVEVFRLIAKHALNAMRYRDLALASIEPPIVIIVPGHSLTDEQYTNGLRMLAERDALEHASRIFDRTFASTEDFGRFLEQFHTADEVAHSVVDPSRLLFDSEWSGTLTEQMERYKLETLDPLRGKMAPHHLQLAVWNSTFGRMMQANDTLLGSAEIRGTPLIDAPTSWQYLLWKYEYDGAQASPARDRRGAVIVKAVEAEGRRSLSLISEVPQQTLIDLRTNGALAELRELIGKGIAEVNAATAASVDEVSSTVKNNLDEAFKKHQEQLRQLSRSRLKFYGRDVSSWIITGSLSIAAAAAGSVSLGILAALAAMAGPPSAKDLARKWHELRSQSQSLRRSPAGLLFKHTRG